MRRFLLFNLPAFICLSVNLAIVASAAFAEEQDNEKMDFVRDIRPIFVKKCYECHGPDEQENKLRLDRRADAKKGGERGPLFRLGKGSDSLLVKFVTGRNGDNIIMPPEGERLSEQQISLLRTWIDQGAKWPDSADLKPTQRGARHWAFQAVVHPPLPTLNDQDWARNPIDAFVLTRLEKERIVPSPEADRTTLIRRLSLDLLGLPPSPDEVDAFLQEPRAGAYERLVDRLLASPHFGERWGRHWLDLARYADSDGYEDDKFRPDAWRYRDWVINAYNRDQSFDKFTIEQIAGDLLDHASYEQKLATGFHRMTLSNDSGGGGIDEEFRVKAVKDRLNTTGTVWLGLSVGCAQCHSHKYDPLSHREYYRLYAFFNNAEEVSIPAPRLPLRYTLAYQKSVSAYDDRICDAEHTLYEYEHYVLPLKQVEWESNANHAELPDSLKKFLSIPIGQRSAEQRGLLGEYFRSIDPHYLKLKRAVPTSEEIKNNKLLPPSSQAMTLSENTTLRETHIHRRGVFLDKGERVESDVPAFLPPLRSRGRAPNRLSLAKWIVDVENALAARVAVNRLWQHLFGRGLVPTPEDFGVHGQPPSHPELLDWLASEFVCGGWRRKSLIKLIVTSSTYRQSSRYRSDLVENDPDNALFARQSRFRVEAEVVRDLALDVGGLLERAIGGLSVQPALPASLLQQQELKTERFMKPSIGADRYRRGVYTNVQRTFVNPMLKAFDVNDSNTVCTRRDRSNTPLQALTLLNDATFVRCAQSLARRVLTQCQGNQRDRAGYAFKLCLARSPTERELTGLIQSFELQLRLCSSKWQATSELVDPGTLPSGVDAPKFAAWIGVSRTLLNLDEFRRTVDRNIPKFVIRLECEESRGGLELY